MGPLDQLAPVVTAFSIAAGVVVFIYSTFATIAYVDKKFDIALAAAAEAKKAAESMREEFRDALADIQHSVKSTEQKVWEIYREVKERN